LIFGLPKALRQASRYKVDTKEKGNWASGKGG